MIATHLRTDASDRVDLTNATAYMKGKIIAAITNGIATSFANTLARDDSFANTGLTEDDLAIRYLDVMGNDAGGSARRLFSLDDGNSADGPADLLTQDVVASTNYSALGARIWITADAKVAYDASVIAAQLQRLAAGEYVTDSFTYAVRLGNGMLSWATATVQIAGINDAPVITSTAAAALGAAQEDTALTSSGQLTAVDVDVLGTTQAWSIVGTSTGTYGSLTVNATGQWTYTLANATNGVAGAVQSLAKDEIHDESFTVRVTDDRGATADQVVTVTVTGTNDAPVVTGGTVTGSVTEDSTSQVTGQLTALDVDHGAQQAWSVTGSSPGGSADYHFRMDSFTVTRNGLTFFHDDFSNGEAPPAGPNGNLTYGGAGIGAFTEYDGRVHFDSTDAVSFVGVGAADPLVGQNAILRSNIDSTSALGLKSTANFTVTGVFDLIIPDSPREQYGIRLTDRHVGGNGTPPDQLGDNAVDFRVLERPDGVVVVRLSKFDFVNDTVTSLQQIDLAPPVDADQIRLTLAHSTTQTGQVTASFDYLSDGTIVGTRNFSAVGHIFQGENWVRAEFIAAAPAINDSQLGGTYGTLNVDQTGTWTYALDDSRAATQALAQGQHATDTFTVQVADEHGAFDTRTVAVDVTGTNDAPIMQTGPVSRTLTEDSNVNSGNLVATGESQFSDVDLTDTHTLTASLNSATLSGGGALPAGLSSLLNNAMAMTLLDPATGDGHAQLQWDFALANSAVQFLAADQTLTLTYNLTADDQHGGTATQVVTVTVNGTNDAPVANTDNLILAGSGDILSVHSAGEGTFLFARVADATNPLVGTWYATGGGEANSTVAITFLADGTYLLAEDGDSGADPTGQDGMERGTYTWNSSTGAFTHVTTVNTNGQWGLSHTVIDGAQVNGDTLTVTGEEGNFSFARVASATNAIVGTWYATGGGEANSTVAITFLADGTYLLAEDGDSGADPSGQDGMERGTYTWDSSSGAFTHVTTVNTNGQWGLSHSTIDDVHILSNGQGLTNEDTPVQIAAATLLANDTDVDVSDTKTLVSVQTPSHGTVSLSAGMVTFTPDLNYNGPAGFTYTMQDAAGAQSTASANFTVNPVNDAPHAAVSASTLNVYTDDPVTLNAAGSSDPDTGDTLAYAWDLDNDGQYDDAAGASVTTAFTSAGHKTIGVRVTDSGGLSDVVSLSVDVSSPTPIILDEGQTSYGTGGGTGQSGNDAASAWNDGNVLSSGNADILANHANAYGGAGGAGTLGSSGADAGGPVYDYSNNFSSWDPYAQVTHYTYNNYYHYGNGNSGSSGGSGGSGGNATSQLLADTLDGQLGADILTLTAMAQGGAGASGGSGGSGSGNAGQENRDWYATNNGAPWPSTVWFSESLITNTYSAGPGGSGGAGGAGGWGGNGATSIELNSVQGDGDDDTILLSATAVGGTAGDGGIGGNGGIGGGWGTSSAGHSGNGGAGGNGGDALSAVSHNTVLGGDGNDTIRLVATAQGGTGGAGGHGADASYVQEVNDTHLSINGVLLEHNYGDYRQYGYAGAGGAGGDGGAASMTIGDNNVGGGDGNDTISLEATVDVGGGGLGGASGSVGANVYTYSDSTPSGTTTYYSASGAGGGNGGNGVNGAFSVVIQGNTLDSGAGDDVIKLAINIVDGVGSVVVSGNTIIGGADTDTLDLSLLGQSVAVDLGAGSLLVGSGSNTVSGIENVIGTALADNLTGSTGNDVLRGGDGNDTLIGGDGSDTFVYQALSDRGTTGDVITDFTTGAGGDVLDLHDLLSTFAGITADTHANAFTGGYLQFTQSAASTLVQVDSDGGANSFVTLAMLTNVLLQQSDVSNYGI